MDQKIQLLSEGFIAWHETFCPRYGWLKKGYDGVRADGGILDAPDAIERLGVGKNMVRSIRFWCAAFKMIEPGDPEKRRLSGFRMQGRRRLRGWSLYRIPTAGWKARWFGSIARIRSGLRLFVTERKWPCLHGCSFQKFIWNPSKILKSRKRGFPSKT